MSWARLEEVEADGPPPEDDEAPRMGESERATFLETLGLDWMTLMPGTEQTPFSVGQPTVVALRFRASAELVLPREGLSSDLASELAGTPGGIGNFRRSFSNSLQKESLIANDISSVVKIGRAHVCT